MRLSLTALCAVFGSFLLSPTQSVGQGVEYTLELSQELLAERNPEFDGSRKVEPEATTTLSFGVLSETPTTSLSAATAASLTVDDAGEVTFVRPSANIGATATTSRGQYGADLSYARFPVAFEEETPDLAVVGSTAERISTTFGVRSVHDLTRTTNLGVSAAVSRLDFDETSDALVPSTSYDLDVSLGHEANSLTSFSILAGVGYFEADNAENTESLLFRVSGSAARELTPRSRINGAVGFTLVDVREVGNDGLTGAFTFRGAFEHDLPGGGMSFSLDQVIRPSASGELVLSNSLQAGISRELNSRTAFGLNVAIARQSDVDGESPEYFLGVSPNLDWQIGPNLSARAGYSYQLRDGGESAHAVSVSVSRRFNGLLR